MVKDKSESRLPVPGQVNVKQIKVESTCCFNITIDAIITVVAIYENMKIYGA